MEIKIKYNGITLTVQGKFQPEEEEHGVREEFTIDEIKYNDIDVFDDYDWEELEEIAALSLNEYIWVNQSNWEDANV